jgi:lipopolysaccharide heptosyltransferase II
MLTPILASIAKIVHCYRLPFNPEDVGSVLVVDINFLGDMVMSSPVYRGLKENLPGASVEALVPQVAAAALRANPYVDAIHSVSNFGFFHLLRASFDLRKKRFDLVLQLNTSLKINFLMWLIGRKYRVGYDYEHRGCFNNLRVPIATRTTRTRYRVDECVDLIEQAFGWRVTNRQMIFRPDQSHQIRIRQVLANEGMGEGDMLFALHTNSRQTQHLRRWGAQKFAGLADELIARYGAWIVLTGAAEDTDYVQEIIRLVHHQERVRSLAGKISLGEFAALLSRSTLFVTINTGPMHIAIAQQTPTVAIIGGTTANVVFPQNDNRYAYVMDPALKRWDPSELYPKYTPLITSITVEEVFAKVECVLSAVNVARLENVGGRTE